MNKNFKDNFLIMFAVAAIFVAFGVVGTMDLEDHKRQRAQYCEMREIYNMDLKLNVPAEDRRGWPNFKDEEYQCDENAYNE
tara:strand:+ start:813 stop:1055 length:243 start_codon:yes stop_codon:yes gene_type:complete